MRKKPIVIAREILTELYVNQGLTIKEIAEQLGYSVTPVFRSLKKHGIPSNPLTRYTRQHLEPLISEIRELYIKRKWTLRSLAKQYKVKSETMRGFLLANGIQPRSISESLKLSAPKRVIGEDGHGRNWQGGKSHNTTNGYITIWKPDHQRASKQGYVYEHILVWEQTHGRKVPKGWVVHHLNGIKTDNRPENLHAMPNGEHVGLARPYKARIRQLEAELKELQQLKLTIG